MAVTLPEDLARIAKKLMFKEPFYGLFLLTLNKQSSESIDTACVSKNGINQQLMVNQNYWFNLTKDEYRMGLLKHELLHIVFFHLHMFDEFENKRLLNIAADLEVNQYLDKSWVHESWITLDKYKDLNLPEKAGTRKYYEILNKNINHPLTQRLLGQDMHPFWKEFSDLSEAERDLLRKQIDYQIKEVVEANKLQGNIPGEVKSYVDGLFTVKPTVFDWKGYMRRFVGNSDRVYTKKTRRKLNKRFAGLPTLKIKTKKHILVGIDTSGSVSDAEIVEFFNEIYHMYKTGVKITIVECDARLHEPWEYKGQPPEFVYGRGGTAFQPVIDYFDEHHKKYTALIYLTDGECSPPTRPRNQMLWVISSKGRKTEGLPGHVIQIPG